MVSASRLLTEPPVQWLTAAPLWAPYDAIEARQQIRHPALLRFASDSFMDDFITVVTSRPERLGEWRATRETWRKPAPTPSLQISTFTAPAVLNGATEDPDLVDEPLKLYMPAHQRFYLVTANLVCRIPGLPDKMLDRSKEEQVSFVLRRHLDGQEYALVDGGWQPVGPGSETTVLPDETRHPMFPVTYREFNGLRRRLLAGLVPVSQREALMTAGRRPGPALPGGETATADDRIEQLMTVLDMDVLSPWREVKRQSRRAVVAILDSLNESEGDAPFGDIEGYTRDQRDLLQVSSWYVLLDLAKFLKSYLPAVWADLPHSTSSLTGARRTLWQRLRSTQYTLDGGAAGGVNSRSHADVVAFRLAAAAKLANEDVADPYLEDFLRVINDTAGQARLADRLVEIAGVETTLETVLLGYEQGSSAWPTQRFLLSGPEFSALVPFDETEEDDTQPPLATLMREALADVVGNIDVRIPLTPLASQISRTIGADDYAADTFVIRCVFERPHCPPGVRPAVVSEPTEAFQMAPYFDPDAPARPIRIPMPIDTTPAGLRKFAKNTMFVLSDSLACQVEAARKITFGDLVLSVLPWPFHKDLPDVKVDECTTGSVGIGMLCTLSIPIITICALILLIIIVLLLDIIFKWVPYLIFCLPLPGLKAKE